MLEDNFHLNKLSQQCFPFFLMTDLTKHRLLRGFETCAPQLIHHHLSAVAYRLLTSSDSD